MEEKDSLSLETELKLYAGRIRLAKNWSQSAFSIVFICLLMFLWSIGFIPGEFMFFNNSNRITIKFISIVVSIIAVIFGFITYKGYVYGQNQLQEFLDKNASEK